MPAERIRIVVVTTAEDLDETFNPHQPLRVVFERALSLVGGHGQGEQFSLEYNDQALNDLDRPISEVAAELGWGDSVELELVPKPVVV